MKNRLLPGSMYFPPPPINYMVPSLTNPNATSTLKPTLSNREAGIPTASQAAGITMPAYGNAAPAANTRALSSNKQLGEILRSIEPRFCYQPAVEELLLEMADHFVHDVVEFSTKLAKHRRSDVLEAKDLQFHLAKNYGISLSATFPSSLSSNTGTSQSSATVSASNATGNTSLMPIGKDLCARSRPSKNSLHMHRIALKRRTLSNIKNKHSNWSGTVGSSNTDRRKIARKN